MLFVVYSKCTDFLSSQKLKISTEITFDEYYTFLVDLFCLYSSVLCNVRREFRMSKQWLRGFAIIHTLNGPKYYMKNLRK